MSDDGVKDCCKQPENLVESRVKEDLLVRVCSVCGCRHFELTAKPGMMGLVGAPL